ncbi:hypothetical protein PF006_g18964 [Phytophthora fragariae]|uniref:Uncharacterized protein n=1 Tax=Phytophthora fragariae TaxID=53985 RepID=A0A6A3E9A6_9STRA|nr:hypothetical protein PF009_g20970 [Phytophthora fragariae]KAE9116762.1 hypothetical protein PF006_g18964 [Phytophthora fragariae]
MTAQQPEDRPAARRPEDRPPPTEDRSGARRPLHVAAWRGAFRMLDCVLRITRANAAEPDAKASSRTGSRHVAESCSRGVLTDQLLQRCYARCWPPKCEGSVSTSNGLALTTEPTAAACDPWAAKNSSAHFSASTPTAWTSALYPVEDGSSLNPEVNHSNQTVARAFEARLRARFGCPWIPSSSPKLLVVLLRVFAAVSAHPFAARVSQGH